MGKILFRIAFVLFAFFIGNSCKKETTQVIYPTDPTEPPAHPVLLKELIVPNLPSPYYYFEYNKEGQPVFISFASDLLMYDINYAGGRVSEMKCKVIVNKDRLQYSYNTEGQVDVITYTDSTGVLYRRVNLHYDGKKLIKAVRELKIGGDPFLLEKTMSFLYYPDGNLMELTDQRYPVYGQVKGTYIDRFEQYDNEINIDGFQLLHNGMFEHFFILPGVQMQKNNPGKLTRTGDGLNYRITYTYTYNTRDLPLSKTGDAVVTNGPSAGKRFQTSAIFSYY